MPRSPKLAIFVLMMTTMTTDRQTDRFTSCTCAWGNNLITRQKYSVSPINICDSMVRRDHIVLSSICTSILGIPTGSLQSAPTCCTREMCLATDPSTHTSSWLCLRDVVNHSIASSSVCLPACNGADCLKILRIKGSHCDFKFG